MDTEPVKGFVAELPGLEKSLARLLTRLAEWSSRLAHSAIDSGDQTPKELVLCQLVQAARRVHSQLPELKLTEHGAELSSKKQLATELPEPADEAAAVIALTNELGLAERNAELLAEAAGHLATRNAELRDQLSVVQAAAEEEAARKAAVEEEAARKAAVDEAARKAHFKDMLVFATDEAAELAAADAEASAEAEVAKRTREIAVATDEASDTSRSREQCESGNRLKESERLLQLEGRLRDSEVELEQASQQLEGARQRLEEASVACEAEMAAVRSQHQAKVATLEGALQKVEGQLAKGAAKQEQVAQEHCKAISDLKATLEAAKREAADAKAELKDLGAGHVSDIEAASTKVAKLEGMLADLRLKDAAKDAQLAAYREGASGNSAAVDDLERKVSGLERQLADSQAEEARCKAELVQTRQEGTETVQGTQRDAVDRPAEGVVALDQEVVVLQARLDKCQRHGTSLEQEHREQIDILKRQHSTTIGELHGEVAQLQADKKLLQEEISALGQQSACELGQLRVELAERLEQSEKEMADHATEMDAVLTRLAEQQSASQQEAGRFAEQVAQLRSELAAQLEPAAQSPEPKPRSVKLVRLGSPQRAHPRRHSLPSLDWAGEPDGPVEAERQKKRQAVIELVGEMEAAQAKHQAEMAQIQRRLAKSEAEASALKQQAESSRKMSSQQLLAFLTADRPISTGRIRSSTFSAPGDPVNLVQGASVRTVPAAIEPSSSAKPLLDGASESLPGVSELQAELQATKDELARQMERSSAESFMLGGVRDSLVEQLVEAQAAQDKLRRELQSLKSTKPAPKPRVMSPPRRHSLPSLDWAGEPDGPVEAERQKKRQAVIELVGEMEAAQAKHQAEMAQIQRRLAKSEAEASALKRQAND